MLSDSDRDELERLIDRDPFIASAPEFTNALRADELAATLFLHRQKPGSAACICGAMKFLDDYTLHLADAIRRTMDVTSKPAEPV